MSKYTQKEITEFLKAADRDVDNRLLPDYGKVITIAKQLRAELADLRNTVRISCTVPETCNDPVVLKKYMKACLEQAEKG